MVYYIIWPYEHHSNTTIYSTHATLDDAYAELDLLAESLPSSSNGFNPYVVGENHLPPNQLPVGE